jgi:hypothetical protein
MTSFALALLIALIPPPPVPTDTPGPGSTPSAVASPESSPPERTVSPSASTSPEPELKTIVTVKSSPYCNALAQHFNDAFVPMLANNVTLDHVSGQLDDLNTLFNKPDFALRFGDVRAKLVDYDNSLLKSLPRMQSEINALRTAQTMTTDPDASKGIHDTAQELQRSYDKQRAITIDLQGLIQGMMDYNVQAHDPDEFNLYEASLPKDERDIKVYLSFDKERNIINDAENKAVDLAYDTAVKQCTK